MNFNDIISVPRLTGKLEIVMKLTRKYMKEVSVRCAIIRVEMSQNWGASKSL